MTQTLRSALLSSVAIAFMFCLMGGSGCSTIKEATAALTDDQLAAKLQKDASTGLTIGLTFAVKEFQGEASKIVADCKTTSDYIKTIALPAFNGASTADVTSATAQSVLTQLGVKMSPNVKPAISIAIMLLSKEVPIPESPTASLDARTKKAISGVLTGIVDAIDAVVAANSPPAAGAPSTARSAPPTLRWATK